jgi:hypothetical protein
MPKSTVESHIDAVALCADLSDHIDKPTLLQLSPSVAILSRPVGIKEIQSWSHFATVEPLVPFASDWRDTVTHPLPDWIGIGR